MEALRKIKLETRTKEYLKADMWCHFGTAIIRGPDEGSIELPSIPPTFKNVIEISNTKPTGSSHLNNPHTLSLHENIYLAVVLLSVASKRVRGNNMF